MSLTIREIVEAVYEGRLRIPAFQRGFVWDPDMVAFLMDSIFKHYPIGSLLFWRTRSQLSHERQIGPFALPNNDPDFPIDYILDGQQRITSIFGVFQTQLEPETPSEWRRIYFDFLMDDDAQESQFFALTNEEFDSNRHLPLNVLFDTVRYRRATSGLSDEIATKIDNMQAVFKEARIPVESISTDNKETVAIIFERVNRQGVPLDTLQLLTAWTWSEDFDLQEQFSTLSEILAPFGFRDIGSDSDLLLRCCAAILARDVAPKTLIELNGAEVRRRFQEVTNGIQGAIDFLRRNVNVHSLENLPFPSIIIPLSVFFSPQEREEVQITDKQRRVLLRWFWRTCFSKRYSSGVIRNLQTDIEGAINLRNGSETSLGEFSVSISPDLFKKDVFRINTVNTKTFVLMLAQKHPSSFSSGEMISLEETLQKYNRNEFHHLMPRAFLRRSNQIQTYHESILANFCFLSGADNRLFGAKPPSEYRQFMPDNVEDILVRAICPTSLFNDDYNKFAEERAELLTNYAKYLCDV